MSSNSLTTALPSKVLQYLGASGKMVDRGEAARDFCRQKMKKIDSVEQTMHTHFKLEKDIKYNFKKKVHVHPQRKKEKYVPEINRKKLSRTQRKKKGLYLVKRKGKLYINYYEDHERWLDYATSLLGIDHFMGQDWSANPSDSRTITVQNKFKKIEFYGSMVEVIRSRCGGYLGLTGIIISETKNMFNLITEKNKVVSIPKEENDFKFTIKNVDINVMGKHLSQRPAERSRHPCKKHDLWL